MDNQYPPNNQNSNQQYPQYQQPQYQPIQNVSPPGKGMSIAAMVLGICSLVVPYGGVALAIVGLILGIMSRKKLVEAGAPTGMATAGIVLSIIALAWSIVLIVICVGVIGAASSLGYYY